MLKMDRLLNLIHVSEEQSFDEQLFQECWKNRFYEYKSLGKFPLFSFGHSISWKTVAIYFVLMLPEV